MNQLFIPESSDLMLTRIGSPFSDSSAIRKLFLARVMATYRALSCRELSFTYLALVDVKITYLGAHGSMVDRIEPRSWMCDVLNSIQYHSPLRYIDGGIRKEIIEENLCGEF